MNDPAVYLDHILESIGRVESYVQGGKANFLESHMVQDAVLRVIQTLAESTQRLPDDWKISQPQIDWGRVAAFRNVLVHAYLGVDLNRVWSIVQKDLPALKKAVESIRAQHSGKAG